MTRSIIKTWKTISARGLPGRVPRRVRVIPGRAAIVCHVLVCTSRKSCTKRGEAPMRSRSPGNFSHALKPSVVPLPFSITSRTAWTSERALTPQTSSRTRRWKALERSMKRTPVLHPLVCIIRQKVRRACEAKPTCWCWKPPICPAGLIRSIRLTVDVLSNAWRRLATDGSSIIPRKCLAVVAQSRLGITAMIPPL